MNGRHLSHIVLASLLVLMPGFAQEAKKGPYAVELKAERTSLFPGQEAEVTLTLSNQGDKVGPNISRSALAGSKNFICARPPETADGEWKGEWAKVASKAGGGGITLHPGESFSMNVRLTFPDSVSEGARAVFLEWRGRSSAMKGVVTPQVIFQMQDGKNPVATLDTNQGLIVLELWPDKAPNHVANFVELAQKEFWDSKVFHRVIKGFMVQTGCPDGTGMGGPGYTLPSEFNKVPFKKGVLGMARTQAGPHTAGSQFFICVADRPDLNEKYTAFGRVLEGQDIADRISNVATSQDRPLDEIKLNRVRVILPKSYKKPAVIKHEG